MRSKKIIPIIFILGLLLAILNLYLFQHLIYAELLFILDISILLSMLLVFILSKTKWLSSNRYYIVKRVFISVFLLVNIAYGIKYYSMFLREQKIDFYTSITTCDQMKIQFLKDVKNKEIKYFNFGITGGFDGKEYHEEKEVHIDNFGLGCIMFGQFQCYNKLVDEYLKEEN